MERLFDSIIYGLDRDFGEGFYYIKKINIPLDSVEELYEEEGIVKVQTVVIATVLTDKFDEWELIHEVILSYPKGETFKEHVKEFLDAIFKWSTNNNMFFQKNEGSENDLVFDDITFTFSTDAFCTRMVIDTLHGEGNRLPIVMDGYQTVGLKNIKNIYNFSYNQVKDVTIWEDVKKVAKIKGTKGTYNIGKTKIDFLIETLSGSERTVSLEVPYIIRETVDNAFERREGWKRYVMNYIKEEF